MSRTLYTAVTGTSRRASSHICHNKSQVKRDMRNTRVGISPESVGLSATSPIVNKTLCPAHRRDVQTTQVLFLGLITTKVKPTHLLGSTPADSGLGASSGSSFGPTTPINARNHRQHSPTVGDFLLPRIAVI